MAGIELFDLAAGAHLRAISVDGEVSRLAFAQDGSWLAVGHDTDQHRRSGTDQRTVTVYDPLSGRAILQQVAQQGHTDAVFAPSPGGRMMARLEVVEKSSSDFEYKIAIWEVLGNSLTARFEAGGSVSALAFAPDRRTLAASVSGGPVFVWDLHASTRDAPRPTPADLSRAWDELQPADGATAFTAIGSSSHAAPTWLCRSSATRSRQLLRPTRNWSRHLLPDSITRTTGGVRQPRAAWPTSASAAGTRWNRLSRQCRRQRVR